MKNGTLAVVVGLILGAILAVPAFSQDLVVKPPSVTNSFFAMDINANNSSDPWPSTVTGITFGTYRTLGSSIKWADVYNCTTGQYTWTNLDKWLTLAKNNGQVVMFTAYYTPECFTAYTGTSGDTSCAFASQPSGCDLPTDVNTDGTGTDTIWKTFISTLMNHVVTTFGTGLIKYIEVWNEPNVSTECNASHNCTQAALARLTEDANITAKAIDSGVLIISPPPTSAQPVPPAVDCIASPSKIANYLNTLLGQKLGGSTNIIPQYADIIGFHGYVAIPAQGTESTNPDPASGAVCVASLVANVQSVVSAYTTKQIYDTEGSWGANCKPTGCTFDPNTWIAYPTPPQTADTQERAFTGIYYLVQASNTACQPTPCNSMAGFSWYGWDFVSGGLSSTGNFWNTSLSPAGYAYMYLTNWLTGITPTAPCAALVSPVGVWTCNFTGSAGYKAEAAWDVSQSCDNTGGVCNTVLRSAPGWATQYRDLYGNTHTISGGKVPIGLIPILVEN